MVYIICYNFVTMNFHLVLTYLHQETSALIAVDISNLQLNVLRTDCSFFFFFLIQSALSIFKPLKVFLKWLYVVIKIVQYTE